MVAVTSAEAATNLDISNADGANDNPLVAGNILVSAADFTAVIEQALARAKVRDFEGAAELLDIGKLPRETDVETQIAWAEALWTAHCFDLHDMLFERLLLDYPNHRDVHVAYAKRLHGRGLLVRALALLEAVSDQILDSGSRRALLRRMHREAEMLTALEGKTLAADADCRLSALEHAITAFRSRELRRLPEKRFDQITFVTGTLAPGGAERQFSLLASQLEMGRRQSGQIGGVALTQPIEALVRSLNPEQGEDFFLPILASAEVVVGEINKMESAAPVAPEMPREDLRPLLDFLPPRVNFGVRRLVSHFQKTKPDVISLWQDGACLYAGLAGLLAGVPQIQLFFRGLPPVIRRHLYHPEYEVMYRAFAGVPGVTFFSNSQAGARAYAEWLGIPIERFSVVYNAVERLKSDAAAETKARWQAFLEETADADHTVGGVFRFHIDKRPLVWIRFAAHYLQEHPTARFVLVGDGRLLDDAKALAHQLGIGRRILFAGRSCEVGYWIRQMDVFVLMSGFEGLPNVLIEAQTLGVPVVTTPAGGAAECLVEGLTGHVLGSADKTDLSEARAKVRALLGAKDRPDAFGPKACDFLAKNFSIKEMLQNYLTATCGGI